MPLNAFSFFLQGVSNIKVVVNLINLKLLALTSQIVDGNCEEILQLLSTNPFTIAKSCIPLF